MNLKPGVLLLTLPLLIACGGDGNDGNGVVISTTTPVQSDSTAAPNSPATQPPAASPAAGASPAATETAVPPTPLTGLPGVGLEQAFPELAFQRMTGMYQDPSGRWYVTEQPGRVRLIDPGNPSQAPVWLDLTGSVDNSGNEMGLLGFALAPDFETSGVFYLNYTAPNPMRTVVSRFQSDDSGADPASEQVILEVQQPFANHNGGQMSFGPDGSLYISFGDGGGAPSVLPQDTNTLLGSLLRIDVSGPGDYTIPPDNPFVDQPGARGEIWAYGFRNPWRFSFDIETGELWLGDVGQSAREEIDYVVPGGNYGWSVMEGSQCLGGGDACDNEGMIPPVFDYARGGGNCSVTGGFVYRGEAVPGLRGAYVYTDYCSGVLWALRADGGSLTEQGQIGSTGFPVSSFAQDNDGEIYVLHHADAGGIYRLTPQ